MSNRFRIFAQQNNKKKKIMSNELFELSGINRLIDFMDDYDIACITAYRDEYKDATPNTLDDRPDEYKKSDEPYKYSLREKKLRNRNLSAYLIKKGYGVTKINGNYIEGYGTIDAKELGEASYFVVNLDNDPDFFKTLFAISEYYNQDCFLYKEAGDNPAYNVGTNACEYPGYSNKVSLGKLHVNVDSEFLSRIKKNSFSFTNNPSKESSKRPLSFEERKQRRKLLAGVLNLEVYENLSRGARQSITAICETLDLPQFDITLVSLNENFTV